MKSSFFDNCNPTPDGQERSRDNAHHCTRNAICNLLGTVSPFIDIEIEKLEAGIRQIFERKGEDIVEMNLKALRMGREFSEHNK